MQNGEHLNVNMLLGVALGVYPEKTRFNRPCQRTATVQNVRVDLWDGPTGEYVFPASAIQMEVVSGNAADAAAGAGARTVHIHYLDANYMEQVETVTLNGITPVNTVATNIRRINGFHVVTAGANGVATGPLSVRAVGGAVTYAFIPAARNRSRHPVFTVPAGKTGYISQWQGSSNSAAGTHMANIDIRATAFDGVLIPGIFLYQDGVALQNGAAEVHLDIPLKFPATCDIKMCAVSDSAIANATAVGNFIGWYE